MLGHIARVNKGQYVKQNRCQEKKCSENQNDKLTLVGFVLQVSNNSRAKENTNVE